MGASNFNGFGGPRILIPLFQNIAEAKRPTKFLTNLLPFFISLLTAHCASARARADCFRRALRREVR
jgi:hypothetical protein